MNVSRPPSRFPGVFIVIVAINLIVYLVQLAKGVHWLSPESKELVAWGANLAPLTLLGEPWRLFTSMFLHVGLIHIAMNMYLLLSVGGLIERAMGRLRFSLA